ncbi:MAG: nidogen-like domain-containing protein [Polyangiales bacterium]
MSYRLSPARLAPMVALSLSCALGAGTAHAIPLLNGFGGPTGYGLPENCVHPNDDGSYSGVPPTTPRAVDIRRAFPDGIDFFGNRYTSMFVNTNGNITFRAALPTYTPDPFPVAQQPMIAPWWGDVDTRGGGQPSRNNICFHIEPNRVVVTWHLVGYYSSHDNLQNSFQLILTRSNTCTTSGDFDVEFRYARCQWTTGDASGGTGGFGGTPAQIGFDAGDSRNYVALPMSRSMAILQVCGSSNVPGGEPGLWRFQIRGGGNDIFGCTGGGQRCSVAGQRGICAEGVQVCTGMTTTCRQVNMPRARACNGLDNDCDGMPDTDDSLCGTGQICELGACVDRCQSELGCPTGRECTPRGACVEAACLNMTCPAEQVCRGGRCVAVCDGITCPHARYCRAGRCIDPCAEITCGAQEVCEVDTRNAVGRCVTACQCRPCAAGQACEANGRCVDMACAGVTCPTGTHCAGGNCRDSCEVGPDARLCPNGEMCELGECVPQRRGGGGTDGGTANPGTDGGATINRDGGAVLSRDGGSLLGRDGSTSGTVDGGNRVFEFNSRSGCQCSAPNGRASTTGVASLLGVLLGVASTRRRRRRD